MKVDLTLEQWDGMKPAERKRFARALALQLPTGFSFRSVKRYRLGKQAHSVAEFEFGGETFVLIPGGAATLGYNPNRHWTPTREEFKSWSRTAAEYGLPRMPRQYLRTITLRRRKRAFRPLLMEATAKEVGWETVELTQAEARKLLGRHVKGPQIIRRGVHLRHADVAADLAKQGFRFPTSDEWEYACGAGADSLFRWGDHVPCDRYPISSSGGWDLHRRPNAFGVTIAFDPYKCELVAEPDVARGGDSGCTICGGTGFFIGWLTLATAYFQDEFCRRDPQEPIDVGYIVGRRVLELT
jgi:hypothetical protein